MKLNLGCGNKRIDGYIGIDRFFTPAVDIVWNLEHLPWQDADGKVLPDASCEEILAHHVLEHLGKEPAVFIGVMKEIYGLLAPGGRLEVKVPHHRSDGFASDPTHVRMITPQTMQLFSKRTCRETQSNHWPNTPLALMHDIDLDLISTEFNLMPFWGERVREQTVTKADLDFALMHYNNVVDEVTMVLHKPAP